MVHLGRRCVTSGGVRCLRVDLTSPEGKNQTEPTSPEELQNQTIFASPEEQNQTIPTSPEIQNHTNNNALCSYPYITRSRFDTSPEGFSPSGDVWFDSGDVVLPREA